VTYAISLKGGGSIEIPLMSLHNKDFGTKLQLQQQQQQQQHE